MGSKTYLDTTGGSEELIGDQTRKRLFLQRKNGLFDEKTQNNFKTT